MTVRETDVLVIGSGIAGLSFVLQSSDRCEIALITKKRRADSNTNYAQGGVAAVVGDEDDVELHVRDTLLAGAGLSHSAAVEAVVRAGPERIRDLIDWGVRFSREQGRLALGREGGHSRRRIVHAADFTGREIERALLDSTAANPRVRIYEDHLAIDLLVGVDEHGVRRCVGARVLDSRTGAVSEFRAGCTLLATGGLGRVYRHTTNPAIATGAGLAMAYRAGAAVANLEFVQFHPTALYPAEDRAVLISEAVRGEGAVLRRPDGEPLLADHPLGSLATRDIVARAIDGMLKETGEDFALLDLAAIPPDRIATRFPTIFAACRDRGIDIRQEPIPVVPASHYACGGVCTDSDGRTSLPGLYAVGEVSWTGVHGANRLASNSLLEALVYATRAARAVRAEATAAPRVERVGDEAPVGSAADAGAGPDLDGAAIEDEIRSLMWEDAGIVRSDARLARAERRLRELEAEIERIWSGTRPTIPTAELRGLVGSARLIVRCAIRRRESRGLHYNIDHPHRDNERFLRDTVLIPDAGGQR